MYRNQINKLEDASGSRKISSSVNSAKSSERLKDYEKYGVRRVENLEELPPKDQSAKTRSQRSPREQGTETRPEEGQAAPLNVMRPALGWAGGVLGERACRWTGARPTTPASGNHGVIRLFCNLHGSKREHSRCQAATRGMIRIV